MAPNLRADINRANAQKSTGPRTESGKQRASQNALSHGLTARNPLLPSEDRDEYLAFTQQFFDALSPQGPVETQLCQTLADCSWKSNRGMSCEQHLLACAVPGTAAESPAALDASVRTLANIGLYQSRTFRMFEKSMKELRQIQTERRLAERAALLEAARQQQAEEAMAEAEAKLGFVFATPERASPDRRRHSCNPNSPSRFPGFWLRFFSPGKQRVLRQFSGLTAMLERRPIPIGRRLLRNDFDRAAESLSIALLESPTSELRLIAALKTIWNFPRSGAEFLSEANAA